MSWRSGGVSAVFYSANVVSFPFQLHTSTRLANGSPCFSFVSCLTGLSVTVISVRIFAHKHALLWGSSLVVLNYKNI